MLHRCITATGESPPRAATRSGTVCITLYNHCDHTHRTTPTLLRPPGPTHRRHVTQAWSQAASVITVQAEVVGGEKGPLFTLAVCGHMHA